MTTEILDAGIDVHVQEARPTTANPDSPQPPINGVNGSRKRIILRFGQLAEKVRGRVITSAYLEGRTRDAHGAYDLAVHALAGGVTDQVTWNVLHNKIGIIANGVTLSIPARAAGERWSRDIGALVQQIANGATHYGFRLAPTSGGDRRFFGFDTPDPTRDWWRLVITYEDETDVAHGLVPDGGVVGVAKTKLTWVTDDPAPEDVEAATQAAYRIQVSHGAVPNAAAPTYDSGNTNGSAPMHDLAAPPSGPVYTAPAADAPRWWRVQTKPVDGPWSAWSDWAFFPWAPKPAINLIAPVPAADGIARIYDSTPLLQAQVAGSIETHRVVVLPDAEGTIGIGAAGARRYDSDEVDAPAAVNGTTTFDHEIPAKARRGGELRRVLDDDVVYRLVIRVEDRADRVASVGDDPFVEVSLRIRYDHDAAIAPATSVTAAQVPGANGNPVGPPSARVVVRRATAPEVWEFYRGTKLVASFEHDDQLSEDGAMIPTGVPGEWYWDHVAVTPLEARTYGVRALDRDANGKLRRSSLTTAAQPLRVVAQQLWLALPHVGMAQIRGDVGVFDRTDQRDTVTPVGAQADYDILYAQRGISWDGFDGVVSDRPGDQDIAETLRVLREIEVRPTATLRLIWGDRNIPVQLRDFVLLPDQEMSPTNGRHRVEFGGWQTGEFLDTKPAR